MEDGGREDMREGGQGGQGGHAVEMLIGPL